MHKNQPTTPPVVTKVKKWFMKKQFWAQIAIILIVGFLIVTGMTALWVATLRIPDLQSFQDKALAESTKIYDRTGEILLYDTNSDVRRQVVPFDEISPYIKNATVAIEDDTFYQHKGIEITSIIRAVLADIATLKFSQGGSTITQQVIKNSLLTTDKKISRKIKEWVLALKLEQVMSKDGILNLYLNSTSYGGTYYGVEEASRQFYGKSARDVTLAEAAYLAAIPQAPTRYSPYGTNAARRAALEDRKNLVLLKMKESGYITEAQYAAAKKEVVAFRPLDNNSIKAPHFSMYIKDYLVQKYGEDVVNNGQLKVITTLDYDLQKTGEEITKKYALENVKKFNAENAALVAIDPKTGQILTMVGSRDYFDKEIDGNYNVAFANRQPGSAFKPFAYATAFNKGFTPDTVLFDLPTEFSTTCTAQGKPINPNSTTKCYMPNNYDLKFRGPMSIRNALAQSINIPAIKALYLAGMKDTLQTAQDMGITTLKDVNTYGLTLVLGGGEVSPIDMTSAYSVFANNGVRNPYTGILKVTDKKGRVLEEYTPDSSQVIPEQTALLINNILYDNTARLPLNGAGAPTDFPGREIALKTGTTNDYKDAWIIGYTPDIAVGAWAGNNDNTSMIKKTSGAIIAPLWRAYFDKALEKYQPSSFKRPEPIDPNLKPILRGQWQGGQTYTIDRTTGQMATEATLPENRQDVGTGEIHTILHYVDRNDPKGPPPAHPENDAQYEHWEIPVRAWVQANGGSISTPSVINNPADAPHVTITTPRSNEIYTRNTRIYIGIQHTNRYPIIKAEFYLNGNLLASPTEFYSYSFVPNDTAGIAANNTLRVVLTDAQNNKGETQVTFRVQ